jgi:type II secretory pathway pseudopilin PulG
MKLCPYCSRTIDDNAQFCNFCGKTLPAATPGAVQDYPPAAMPGEGQTSGKAIGSLICGILCFFLPASIVAIVLGHLSLSEISKSAGRLKGRGMALAGLILGYLGIAVIPVLIIAAIAIPNLLRARIAANEASAVGSLRTLNTACVTYYSTYNTFPPTLASLAANGQPSANAASLIDSPLASGLKSGYAFTYEAGPAEDGRISIYNVHADPVTQGTTGTRHFFTDQTEVIRVSMEGPADNSSPPLL